MKTYILSLDPDGTLSRWGFYHAEELGENETARETLVRAIADDAIPHCEGIFLVQQEKSMMGNLFCVRIEDDRLVVQDDLPESLKYELRYRTMMWSKDEYGC